MFPQLGLPRRFARALLLSSVSVVIGACATSSGGAPAPPGVSASEDDIIRPPQIAAGASGEGDQSAVGVASGAGDDVVETAGPVSVEADTSGAPHTLGGAGPSSAQAVAMAVNAGIGDDRVVLSGASDVHARAVTGPPNAANAFSLTGLVGLDQSRTASANAVGLFGAGGDDRLENRGDMTVNAEAEAQPPEIFDLLEGVNFTGQAIARAFATGLDGGDGADAVGNFGPLDVGARASVTDDSSTDSHIVWGFGDLSLAAGANATGLSGGEGADEIVVAESLIVRGDASVTQSGFTFADLEVDLLEAKIFGAAGAVGVDAGGGNDLVTFSSGATVDADVRLLAASVTIAALRLARAETDLTAAARAYGALGGGGGDTLRIDPNGVLIITADAIKDSQSFELTFLDTSASFDEFKLAQNAPLDEPDAAAGGLMGEGGADMLRNEGVLSVSAGVDASNLAVAIGGPATPPFMGLVTLDPQLETGASAYARALGLDGGDGDDEVASLNRTDVAASAAARFSLGQANNPLQPQALTIGEAFERQNIVAARTESRAEAQGLAGGGGADSLDFGGDLGVNASSSAHLLNVAVDLAFEGKPAPGAGASSVFDPSLALMDVAALSMADAAGLDGGAGVDALTVRAGADGRVRAEAFAKAMSVNVEAGVSLSPKAPVSFSAALFRSGVHAAATSLGLAGGDGEDAALVDGALRAEAEAGADSELYTAELVLGRANFSADVSAFQHDADAVALAIGIDADTIGVGESGVVGADAASRAAQTSAAISIDAASQAASVLDIAIVSLDSRAEADAVGLNSGWGGGSIRNAGRVEADARADADSLSVTGSLALAPLGAALRVGAVSGLVEADAHARGVVSLSDEGLVENRGALSASSEADASSQTFDVGVAVIGGGGVAGGFSLFDARQRALARAYGLELGGQGAAALNTGALTIDANAEAHAVGVDLGLDIVGGAGVALDINLVDGESRAEAQAAALRAFGGDAILANEGQVTVASDATAWATNVSASWNTAGVGVSGGGSFVLGANIADAEAAGLSSGAGADMLTHGGALAALDVRASALAQRLDIDVDVSGAGLGLALNATAMDIALTASADAAGFTAGGGADSVRIDSDAGVRADARTQSTALNLGLSFAGAGLAGNATFLNASQFAEAAAAGARGEDGADGIINTAALDVAAVAQAKATGVSVTASAANLAAGLGLDAAFLGFGAVSDAEAVGLDGDSVGALAGGGDELRNEGALDVDAVAVSEAGAVAVNVLLGGAFADADAQASARAAGMSGRAGDDLLVQTGELDARARATGRGLAASASLAGVDMGAARTVADAQARGLDGGEGDDMIFAGGETRAHALATLAATSVGVTGLGFAAADASARADALAIGADGGAGDDAIGVVGVLSADAVARAHENADNDAFAGPVAGGGQSQVVVSVVGVAANNYDSAFTALAQAVSAGAGADEVLVAEGAAASAVSSAELRNRTIAVSGVGASLVSADQSAHAIATGIALGDGADILEAAGAVSAHANVLARNFVLNLNGVGASLSSGGVSVLASAAGVSGDDTEEGGGDILRVLETGSLLVRARAEATEQGLNINLAGAGITDRAFTLKAEAFGARLGAGDDDARIAGRLDVGAVSLVNNNNFTLSGIGFAGAGNALGANAFATGLSGEDGDDHLAASGLFHSLADATAALRTLNISALGFTSGEDGVGASAHAIGLDGGAGDDMLAYAGADFLARANAVGDFDGANFSGAGAAQGSNSLTATARAAGAAGGLGDDLLLVSGKFVVEVESSLDTDSATRVAVGFSSNADMIVARANAVGLDGGAGADELHNEAGSELRVRAGADSNANGSSFVFLGATKHSGYAASYAAALGMSGGEGDDRIFNDGGLAVIARAGADSRGASVGFGAGNAARTSAETISTVFARGIDGGGGRDVIVNSGLIDVDAHAFSYIENSASAGGLWVNSITDGHVFGFVNAAGVDSGAGGGFIRNDGTIDVDVFTADALTERVRIVTVATNPSLSLGNTANARAISSMNDIQAYGVLAGAGDTEFINAGDILVTVNPDVTAVARAPANGVASANGDAEAIVGASGARVAGVRLGEGAAQILNEGRIEARLAIRAGAYAFADADGLPGLTSDPDATTRTTINLNNNEVAGIWVGGGGAAIENAGEIVVANSLRAQDAVAESIRGHNLVFGVDTFATAIANISNASAYGIRADSGDNFVRNTGRIDVLVDPRTRAETRSNAGGIDGDTTARPTARVNGAWGYGVFTGGGNDVIVNEGEIQVHLDPVASAGLFTSTGEFGSRTVNEVEELTSIFSYGIFSGAGDDIVVNAGSIVATRTRGSGNVLAIETADGDDVVELMAGSRTEPHIQLGAGDDHLIFHGGAVVTGSINGQGGADLFEVVGAGAFGGTLIEFESLRKSGEGAFSVTSPMAWQSIEVSGGALTLPSLAANADYSTFVNGDGAAGLLNITADGTTNFRGDFSVTAGGAPFSDGQSFTILHANALSYLPASETLPTPTPLLSFSTQAGAQDLRVIAHVASFATAAANANQASLGSAFDAALDDAGGSFAAMLGALQQAPDLNAIQGAYDALLPEARVAPVGAGFSHVAADAVRDRLHMLSPSSAERFGFARTQFTPLSEGRFRVWAADLRQEARFRGDSGLEAPGFGSDAVAAGFDTFVTPHLALGASIAADIRLQVDDLRSATLSPADAQAGIYAVLALAPDIYLHATAATAWLEPEALARGARMARDEDRFAFAPLTRNEAALELGRRFALSESHGGDFYVATRRWGGARDGALDVTSAGFGQTVTHAGEDGWEAALGLRFDVIGESPLGVLSARLGLEYAADLEVDAAGLLVRFADAPEHPFVIDRDERAASTLRFKADAALFDAAGATWRVMIDAETRGDSTEGAARLEMRRRF